MNRRYWPATPLIAAVTLVLAVPDARAQQASPTEHTVTVIGRGSVSVVPDLAYLSGSVQTKGKTASEALNANSAAMARVIEQLKGSGFSSDDILTVGVSLSPELEPAQLGQNSYPISPGAMRKIIGYTAQNSIRLRLRDVSKVSDTIPILVSAGINQLSGITFDVSEPNRLRLAARRAAVEDARQQAEAMLLAAGRHIGGLLRAEDAELRRNTGTQADGEADLAAPDPNYVASVPISPGQRFFTHAVVAVWEIAP